MTDLATRKAWNRSTPRRVWARIAVGSVDECWPWSGPKNKDGYGTVTYHGRHWKVHRLVLTFVDGAPTPGQEALHGCDNPPCANPFHLRWGSRQQNVIEAVERGLHRTGRESWTRCVNGHRFTPANTRTDRRGNRKCRACEYERTRRYRATRRATA